MNEPSTQPPPPQQQQQQTETFQHYQVLRKEDGSLWELGRGAMGVTYKAIDTNLRSYVALKVINTLYLDSDMARQRFVREAKAAASLRHRNVANVYHLGDDGQSFFYSMEFIDGDTVQGLVDKRGPLPPAEALGITLQVARALGAAAKQQLVHRDIKPANLMVVKEDDDDDDDIASMVVKVIDFGLARSSVSGADSGHITMGGFVGTPQFASPEQLEEQTLDTRSDIYSLGITLWYMLCGNPPFTGSVFRISSQHLSKEPPWEQLEGTPQPVKALLAHMLQKDPANRPQTPTKLRLEIEACLKELAAGVPAEAVHPVIAKAFEPTPPSLADETLSSASALASASEAAISSMPSTPVAAGNLFAGRYFLVRHVGEGNTGVVYQARDDWSDGRPVAVKTFHRELGLTTQDFYHLQGDLGKLVAAPHPNLLVVHSLEQIEGHKFSVSEWVRGFTVVDLLRSRGRLPLREAMSLLGQACEVAAHATANRLHKLELAPHQIMLNFPGGFGYSPEQPEEANALAALLPQSMSLWPAFCLKVDALAPAREDAALMTWAGDMTMAVSQPRMPSRDTQSSIRGLIEGSYLFSLAALVYELLDGAPPDVNRQLPALSTLNEAANQVLRRALQPNPDFAGEREFFQELLAASDLPPDQLFLAPTAPVAQVPASVAPVTPPGASGHEDAAATMMDATPAAIVEARAAVRQAASTPTPTEEPRKTAPSAASGPTAPTAAKPTAAAVDSAAVSLGMAGRAAAPAVATPAAPTVRQAGAAQKAPVQKTDVELEPEPKPLPWMAIAAGVVGLAVLGGVGMMLIPKPKQTVVVNAGGGAEAQSKNGSSGSPGSLIEPSKTQPLVQSSPSTSLVENRTPTPAPVMDKPSQDQPPIKESTPALAADKTPTAGPEATPAVTKPDPTPEVVSTKQPTGGKRPVPIVSDKSATKTATSGSGKGNKDTMSFEDRIKAIAVQAGGDANAVNKGAEDALKMKRQQQGNR